MSPNKGDRVVLNRNSTVPLFRQNWRTLLHFENRELNVKTTEPLEARENAGDQVAIGVSFESDWLRKWQTSRTIHRAK